MRTQRIVYAMLALSIAVGVGPLEATPVAPAMAEEEGDATSDPCATVDPYTGEVTVDPDCVTGP